MNSEWNTICMIPFIKSSCAFCLGANHQAGLGFEDCWRHHIFDRPGSSWIREKSVLCYHIASGSPIICLADMPVLELQLGFGIFEFLRCMIWKWKCCKFWSCLIVRGEFAPSARQHDWQPLPPVAVLDHEHQHLSNTFAGIYRAFPNTWDVLHILSEYELYHKQKCNANK